MGSLLSSCLVLARWRLCFLFYSTFQSSTFFCLWYMTVHCLCAVVYWFSDYRFVTLHGWYCIIWYLIFFIILLTCLNFSFCVPSSCCFFSQWDVFDISKPKKCHNVTSYLMHHGKLFLQFSVVHCRTFFIYFTINRMLGTSHEVSDRSHLWREFYCPITFQMWNSACSLLGLCCGTNDYSGHR